MADDTNEADRDLTMSECAARLGISPSALSQYITAHPDLRSPTGRYDLAEVRAHRAANVNFAKSQNWRGIEDGAGADVEVVDDLDDADADELAGDASGDAAASTPAPAAPRPPVSPLAQAKTDLAVAQAQARRIAVAREQGLLVERARVEEAARDAARHVQDGLRVRNAAIADRLASMSDPRAIRAFLDEQDRDLLGGMAAILSDRDGEATPSHG